MLRLLLFTTLIASTIPEASADSQRHDKPPKPTPKATNRGGLFKKKGEDPIPSESKPPENKTTKVPGLDYEPRRREEFDDQGRPTGLNLLINRVDDAQFRLRLKHASSALDDWARKVEEFGNVTMSSPILTRENDAFEFAIKENAQTFFENARTRKDGGAAAVLAIVNQFSAAGQATFDPLSATALTNTQAISNAELELFQRQSRANIAAQKAKEEAARIKRDAQLEVIDQSTESETVKQQKRAEVLKTYATEIEGTATKPTLTTSEQAFDDALKGPTEAAPAAAQKQAETTATQAKTFTDLVLEGNNSAFFPAVASGSTLPDRTAMIDAAGTNTVKAIFKILGKPEAAMQFEDKTVLFATVTVAVNPGWRTKKDFAADISGQASYRMVRARTDVVDAFRLRLGKYEECILKNHGLPVPPKEEANQSKTIPKVGDSEELKKARSDLAEARRTLEKSKADYAKAVAPLIAQSAAVAESVPAVNGPVSKPATDLVPAANAPRVATYIGSKLSGSIKALAKGDKQQQEQFAEVAKTKVEAAANTIIKEGAWRDAKQLPDIVDQLNTAVEILDATNKAHWESQTTANPAGHGIETHPEPMRLLASECRDALPISESVVANEKNVIEEENNVVALEAVDTRGGPQGSGDGAGDFGPLKVTDDYFDRVTFDKQPPLVAGISPLMETQVLDLKDRFGRQDQITIALAAAFRQNNVKGAASIFERFMKTQTKSAATLSSLPVVNTYSASGGLFGFQVGPRLRALEDPAARKGGSANVLDRQSFPAVLIIGIDRADLSPRICRDYDGKYYLFEPQLVIKQTSRWNPLDGRLFTPFKTTWWNPFAWHNARYSERERVDNLLNVADNFRDLTQWLEQEDSRTSAHVNGRRFGESRGDALEDVSKDCPPLQGTLTTGATPPCKDSDRAIYNDEFARHAYTDVVQSLVRRLNALKELSTGSESRQYLPLSLLEPKKKPAPPEALKEPRLAALVPPSITVTLPSAPPATSAADIAQDKAQALDAIARFGTSAGLVTTFYTPTGAGIDKIMTDDAAANTMYKAINKPVDAEGKPREANPVELQALRSKLVDLKAGIDDVNTALGTVKTRVTDIQGAVNATTTVVGTVTQLTTFLEADAPRLLGKINAVPPLTDDEKAAYRKEKIDPTNLVKYARDAHAELANVKAPAQKLVTDSSVGVTMLPIYFAVTGENMKGLKRVAASVPNTVLSFAEIGDGKDGKDGGRPMTRLEGDSVLFRANLKASGVVYFRLDFEVNDPAHPNDPIKRVLFTPPLVLSFNGTAPLPTDSGYFDANGKLVVSGPASSSALPSSQLPSPSPFPANNVPRTAMVPTLPEDERVAPAITQPSEASHTRRLAQGLDADFTTELFPPVRKK